MPLFLNLSLSFYVPCVIVISFFVSFVLSIIVIVCLSLLCFSLWVVPPLHRYLPFFSLSFVPWRRSEQKLRWRGGISDRVKSNFDFPHGRKKDIEMKSSIFRFHGCWKEEEEEARVIFISKIKRGTTAFWILRLFPKMFYEIR